MLTRINVRDIINTERRDNMELVKSKGMIIFLVIILGFTIINSIETKKYDSRKEAVNSTYLSYTNN